MTIESRPCGARAAAADLRLQRRADAGEPRVDVEVETAAAARRVHEARRCPPCRRIGAGPTSAPPSPSELPLWMFGMLDLLDARVAREDLGLLVLAARDAGSSWSISG